MVGLWVKVSPSVLGADWGLPELQDPLLEPIVEGASSSLGTHEITYSR